jgi:hypothetical protein
MTHTIYFVIIDIVVFIGTLGIVGIVRQLKNTKDTKNTIYHSVYLGIVDCLNACSKYYWVLGKQLVRQPLALMHNNISTNFHEAIL